LVFDITDHMSAYTSYTTIFNPSSRKDINGDYLDPEDGNSIEAGIKADFIYAIKQDNSPIQLHLVVETKSDNMRMSDEVAVQSQQKAFEYIKNIQWRLNNKVQDFERDLKDLVMTR
jgi:outer membrane receptor for ferric coprogen and ferric-rhodotorulic acid